MLVELFDKLLKRKFEELFLKNKLNFFLINFSSAAYLHSFRETSQHRLNTMRVQTLSSLRNPGHLMRAGMHILTTQVNSLRDYCGVTTGHPLSSNYLYQQQQQFHDLRHSPMTISYLHQNRITTISEEDESIVESTSLDQTPYVGHASSAIVTNTSGIGKLNAADNSVLLALNNFNSSLRNQRMNNENFIARGEMSAGIGTFHGHMDDPDDDLINEPERLIMYGQQRPAC
jgi:hypothetical protein